MSLWSWITGVDLEAVTAADKAATEKSYALTAAQYGPGGKYYNPTDWATTQKNYADQANTKVINGQLTNFDATAEVQQEFMATAVQPIKSAFSFTGDFLGSIFKAIPLWAWLLIGLWIFLSLGGLGIVKKQIGKYA